MTPTWFATSRKRWSLVQIAEPASRVEYSSMPVGARAVSMSLSSIVTVVLVGKSSPVGASSGDVDYALSRAGG